jgi:peptide/nickel transport system substrate-binding protein
MLSLAVVLGVVSTVACSPPATATARPEPTGVFRVLVPSAPSTLNPNVLLDEIALLAGRSIFSHLLTVNETGRLLPELAESWTVTDDGLTYTFGLRRDVQWHDGRALTAADVRWTYETVARDGFAREALAPVQSIDTPNAHTVVITLRHAWAPFAYDLAGAGLSILPRHVYEGSDWRTHAANARPIGTGPFRFDRWLDEQTVALAANTRYFRSGPYVRQLIFEAVPGDAIDAKLVSGEADYSVVRPTALDAQAPPEGIVIRTLPSSARYYLAMNLRRRPFADARVRTALASAIDRLDIVRDALAGMGAPAIGWYTPDVEWAYNSEARVPDHDPLRARRLLDAAGLPMRRGERFQATLIVPHAGPLPRIAEALRAQLAAVGVRINLTLLPPGQWPQRVLDARDFDLAIISGAQGPDPDQLRRRFLAGTDSGDYIGYDAADFREAVERGARTVDLSERAAAYLRAQEILARDVPFIPLAESVKVIVFNQRVSGLPQLEARGLVGAFDFSLVKLGATRAMGTR